MYRQNQTLVELLQPVISAMGYELWGVEHLPKGDGSLLRVYIDQANGITLDDCGRVSGQVSGVLDVNDPVSGAYYLEVSSPGLDRPLFTPEQLRRYIGHRANFKLRTKLDGRRNFTGEIVKASDEIVIIHDADEKYSIPVDMIDKAHLSEQIK